MLVVGAGLSGIGAAYYLKERCPGHRFAILEARHTLGGTWDLFRYPGVRSDSDMHTLGFAFRPWEDQKAIADGPAILKYLHETAAENGIDQHIRYHRKVTSAKWSSATNRWTVTVFRSDEDREEEITCSFLFMCSGYYDYAGGHAPDFDGQDDFQGEIVHPQKWADDVAYEGKRVVVIGSGATAMTLVPELAKKAAHVTMLQRSPTYVVSKPAEDAIANRLRKRLPAKLAYGITRWKNVGIGMFGFSASRRLPKQVKKLMIKGVREALGPDYDVEKHFTPRYNPWDQRVCLVPDGDLFKAIRSGDASVVTDHIDRFTKDGILLKSGEELPADLIVTATGLRLLFLSGMTVHVDGQEVKPADTMTYKAMMFRDVPNMAVSFGYTNASWTLKSDLTGEYVARLLGHMKRNQYLRCTPRQNDPDVHEIPFLDFSSGYVTRASANLPKQGSKVPWRLDQNYALDILNLRYSKVDDGIMEFR